MNIAKAFGTFDNNLKVSSSTRTTIANRHNSISQRINADFRKVNSTSNTLYVGSYGRNTATEGISDVDMLMILPYLTYIQYNSYQYNGQSSLLQAVKNSIASTYPRTRIKGDGQIVQVTFSDGNTFELLPCFENTDGSFTFPDSNDGGSWKTTNPRPEIKAFQDLNKDCNGNLYALCRMARAWKYSNNILLKSCLLDLFAYRFLQDYQYKDKSYAYYDWMARDFFAYLANIPETQNSWRMVGSNRIYTDSSSFQSKAKKTKDKCIEAIEDASKGYIYSAYCNWRKIFGTKFPYKDVIE